MQVEVKYISNICAGTFVGTHLADHGQDGRESFPVGGVECYMDYLRRVDDFVDCCEFVFGCRRGGVRMIEMYSDEGGKCEGLTLFWIPLDRVVGFPGIF